MRRQGDGHGISRRGEAAPIGGFGREGKSARDAAKRPAAPTPAGVGAAPTWRWRQLPSRPTHGRFERFQAVSVLQEAPGADFRAPPRSLRRGPASRPRVWSAGKNLSPSRGPRCLVEGSATANPPLRRRGTMFGAAAKHRSLEKTFPAIRAILYRRDFSQTHNNYMEPQRRLPGRIRRALVS